MSAGRPGSTDQVQSAGQGDSADQVHSAGQGPGVGPVDYDGRRFSTSGAEADEHGRAVPVGHYHQSGDLIWAEIAGGEVRDGRLVGRPDAEGVIEAGYCMLISGGEVVLGRLSSRPTLLADGRVALEERWRRDDGSAGTAWLEQLPPD